MVGASRGAARALIAPSPRWPGAGRSPPSALLRDPSYGTVRPDRVNTDTLIGYLVLFDRLEAEMAETISYRVPGMHCGHCEASVKREVGAVAGVEVVEVDLETKLVTVRGERLEDAALRAAIDEAGFDVADAA